MSNFMDEFNNGEDFDTDGGFNGFSVDEEEDFYDDDEPEEFGSNEPSSFGKIEEDSTDKAEERKGFKKTSIYLVLLAIGILVFIAIVLNLISHAKKTAQTRQVATVQETQANIAQTQATIEQTVLDLGGKKSTTAETTVASVPSQQTEQTNLDGWVEVGLSSSNVDFGEPLEGIFTVTDITTYARLSGVGSDKQVKSVLSGSISGLTGTYVVELPADKALKLGVGNSFKIDYQLKTVNGYKLVGEIRY